MFDQTDLSRTNTSTLMPRKERPQDPDGQRLNDRRGSILLKNSILLPGCIPHQKVDRSGCAASDASEQAKASTTLWNRSKVRAEEFFNTIGRFLISAWHHGPPARQPTQPP